MKTTQQGKLVRCLKKRNPAKEKRMGKLYAALATRKALEEQYDFISNEYT